MQLTWKFVGMTKASNRADDPDDIASHLYPSRTPERAETRRHVKQNVCFLRHDSRQTKRLFSFIVQLHPSASMFSILFTTDNVVLEFNTIFALLCSPGTAACTLPPTVGTHESELVEVLGKGEE